MTITSSSIDVPRVRDLLDAGTLAEYLTETDTLDNIGEEIVANRRTGHSKPPRTDEEVHQSWERVAGICAEHGQTVEEHAELSDQHRFELILENLLRQIIAEGLADEVEAALPAETVKYFTDQAEATAGREWLVTVEERDSYRCGVTGVERSGRVLVIQPRWEGDRSAMGCPVLISPDQLPGGDFPSRIAEELALVRALVPAVEALAERTGKIIAEWEQRWLEERQTIEGEEREEAAREASGYNTLVNGVWAQLSALTAAASDSGDHGTGIGFGTIGWSDRLHAARMERLAARSTTD